MTLRELIRSCIHSKLESTYFLVKSDVHTTVSVKAAASCHVKTLPYPLKEEAESSSEISTYIYRFTRRQIKKM
jgi:hypothetical protein